VHAKVIASSAAFTKINEFGIVSPEFPKFVMELFRLPIWDITLIGSVNRLQWDLEADFQVTRGRVWLSDTGRRKAIELFEKRLGDVWRHPAIGYSLSYARLIELEVRLLEKEWTGQPGLFARMRLR
jgi:CRISPR-associated protein Cas1